jgi:hypothetical protein
MESEGEPKFLFIERDRLKCIQDGNKENFITERELDTLRC